MNKGSNRPLLLAALILLLRTVGSLTLLPSFRAFTVSSGIPLPVSATKLGATELTTSISCQYDDYDGDDYGLSSTASLQACADQRACVINGLAPAVLRALQIQPTAPDANQQMSNVATAVLKCMAPCFRTDDESAREGGPFGRRQRTRRKRQSNFTPVNERCVTAALNGHRSKRPFMADCTQRKYFSHQEDDRPGSRAASALSFRDRLIKSRRRRRSEQQQQQGDSLHEYKTVLNLQRQADILINMALYGNSLMSRVCPRQADEIVACVDINTRQRFSFMGHDLDAIKQTYCIERMQCDFMVETCAAEKDLAALDALNRKLDQLHDACTCRNEYDKAIATCNNRTVHTLDCDEQQTTAYIAHSDQQAARADRELAERQAEDEHDICSVTYSRPDVKALESKMLLALRNMPRSVLDAKRLETRRIRLQALGRTTG